MGSKTPERISMKLGIYNYVGGMTTHANHMALRRRGWSRRTRDCQLFRFLSILFFFLYFILGIAPSQHWWIGSSLTICTSYDVFPRKEVPFGVAVRLLPI